MRRPSPYEDTGLFVSALSAYENRTPSSTTLHALHQTRFSNNVTAIISVTAKNESSVCILPLTLEAEDFDRVFSLRHVLARDAVYLASVETPDSLLVLTKRIDGTLELHHVHPARLYEERSYTLGLRLPDNPHCHLVYDVISKNIFILATGTTPSHSFDIIKADIRLQGVYTASVTPSPGFDPIPYNPKHAICGRVEPAHILFELVDASLVGDGLFCLLRLSLRDEKNSYRTMVVKINKTTLQTDKAFGVKGNWVSQYPYPHLKPLSLAGLTSLYGVSSNHLVRLTLRDDGDGLLKEETLSVALGFTPSVNSRIARDAEGNSYVVSLYHRILSVAKVLQDGTLEPTTGRQDISLGAHTCTLADVVYHPASESLLIALDQHVPMLTKEAESVAVTLPRFIKINIRTLRWEREYANPTSIALLPLQDAMMCRTKKSIYFAQRVKNGELFDIVLQQMNHRGGIIKTASIALPTPTTRLTILHLTSASKIFLAGSTVGKARVSDWLVKLHPDLSLDKGFGNNGIVTFEDYVSQILEVSRQRIAVLAGGKVYFIGESVKEIAAAPLGKSDAVVFGEHSLLFVRVKIQNARCIVRLQRVTTSGLDEAFESEVSVSNEVTENTLEITHPDFNKTNVEENHPRSIHKKMYFIKSDVKNVYLFQKIKVVALRKLKNYYYLVCTCWLARGNQEEVFVVVTRFDEHLTPDPAYSKWLGWDEENDIAYQFGCSAVSEATPTGVTLAGIACPILHLADNRGIGYTQPVRDRAQIALWQLSLDGEVGQRPVFAPVSRDIRLEVRDVDVDADNIHVITSLGLVAVSRDGLRETLKDK